MELVDIINQCGVPPGVVNLLSGDPSSIVRYDIFNVRFDVNLAITLRSKPSLSAVSVAFPTIVPVPSGLCVM